MSELRSASEYRMAGRGVEFQFFATDREIQELIDRTLPLALAPYRGLAVALRKPADRSTYDRERVDCAIGEIIRCARAQAVGQVWIGSEALTSTMSSAVGDPSAWSLSGMISVEPGLKRRGAQEESRISCVPRVINVRTNAVEQNSEYKRLYDTLRKAIKGQLTWTTVRVRPNGGSGGGRGFQVDDRGCRSSGPPGA